MLLEKEHDNYNSENELRQQCEKLLEETKQLHDKTSQEVNHQRKQGSENGSSIINPHIDLVTFLSLGFPGSLTHLLQKFWTAYQLLESVDFFPEISQLGMYITVQIQFNGITFWFTIFNVELLDNFIHYCNGKSGECEWN